MVVHMSTVSKRLPRWVGNLEKIDSVGELSSLLSKAGKE